MNVLAEATFDPRTGTALIAAAAVTLTLLIRSGVLRERTFRQAPPRDGALSLFDVLIAMGLIVLGWVLGSLVAKWGGSDSGKMDMPRIIGSHVGLLPVLVYIPVRAHLAMRGGIAAFGLGLRDRRRTMLTILIGIPAMFALTLGVTQVLLLITLATGRTPPDLAHPTLKALAAGQIGPTEIAMVISAVLVAPLFEELMFRGLCQTALNQSGVFATRWAVIVSMAVLFTLLHVGEVITWAADGTFEQFAWQALVVLLVLSLCLGYVYERTGSLWTSILMHMAFNAVNIAIVIARPVVPTM